MSYDKQRPARPSFPQKNFTTNQKDPDDLENEVWSPTKEKLQAFFARDLELARTNLRLALLTFNGRPCTAKDLKEASLHSIDMVEQTLLTMVKAGQLVEDKGKFTLATP
jgi:hypothetical protein